jgi:hypothetical protein
MKALAGLLLIATSAVFSQAQEQPKANVQPESPSQQPVATAQEPVAVAQEPVVTAPKDVLILKFNCQKARVFAVMEASQTSAESFEDVRRRVGREMVINSARNQPGGKAAVGGMPATTPPPLVVLPHARNGYRYSVSLQNAGPLAIKYVVWDYIFSDPVTHRVIARHHFSNAVKIKPGKTKVLEGFKLFTPTKTVSAAGLERNSKNPHTEQVVLKSIVYEDGSFWPQP